jgi:hypothetical protein
MEDNKIGNLESKMNTENLNDNEDARDNLLKRKRKKSNYKKINNETRQKLIEMVHFF